jgi:hypothetical protein
VQAWVGLRVESLFRHVGKFRRFEFDPWVNSGVSSSSFALVPANHHHFFIFTKVFWKRKMRPKFYKNSRVYTHKNPSKSLASEINGRVKFGQGSLAIEITFETKENPDVFKDRVSMKLLCWFE